MRILAILSNCGLLGFACFQLAKRGLPSGGEVPLVLLLFAAPILNFITLILSRDGKGWLTLYLKRKALEEQRKIDQIKKHDAA
jgi:hypothetical protein